MEDDLLLQIKQLREKVQSFLQQEQELLNRYSICKQSMKDIEQVDIIKLYMQKNKRLALVKKCQYTLSKNGKVSESDIDDLLCLHKTKLDVGQLLDLLKNEFDVINNQISHLELDDIVKSYLECKGNLKDLVDKYCQVLKERQKSEADLATCLRKVSVTDFEQEL